MQTAEHSNDIILLPHSIYVGSHPSTDRYLLVFTHRLKVVQYQPLLHFNGQWKHWVRSNDKLLHLRPAAVTTISCIRTSVNNLTRHSSTSNYDQSQTSPPHSTSTQIAITILTVFNFHKENNFDMAICMCTILFCYHFHCSAWNLKSQLSSTR